ncbi:MAG: dihydrolipoyl dehydrogenase [bacterium]
MRPAQPEFDLIVLGGGPAGYVAAIRAAQLQFKTAIVDPERLGGICLNWGCIPTKALLKSASAYLEARRLSQFGIDAEVKGFNFARIISRSRQIADRSSAGVEYLVRKNGITKFEGMGRLVSPNEVAVLDKNSAKEAAHFRAKHIIIATGGHPKELPGARFDGRRIVTYKEAMNLAAQPKSLVVIGAGAIGVEFAFFYAALGTKVTLIEMLEQILPTEDHEVADALTRSLLKLDIEIHTSTAVQSVRRDEEGVTILAQGPKGEILIRGEMALVAIGVDGNSEGLEAFPIRVEKSFVAVNQKYQTGTPGIWAVGDVIGPPLLAHVASREAVLCVEEIAGLAPAPMDYESIPACTYCQPQVASIGLTEKKCHERGIEISVGRFPFVASGKARAAGDIEGFVKVISEAKTGKLLGAHMVGAEVTELISELSLARTLGLTGKDILRALHPHPTLSEAVMEATAAALGEAIHL